MCFPPGPDGKQPTRTTSFAAGHALAWKCNIYARMTDAYIGASSTANSAERALDVTAQVGKVDCTLAGFDKVIRANTTASL